METKVSATQEGAPSELSDAGRRRLKVFAWQSHRMECPRAANGSRQTREIVAATSQREAARLSGHKGPWQMFNLSETGNEREVEIAMASPGIVFWMPINCRDDDYRPASENGIVNKPES